jgi:hypothetical protein
MKPESKVRLKPDPTQNVATQNVAAEDVAAEDVAAERVAAVADLEGSTAQAISFLQDPNSHAAVRAALHWVAQNAEEAGASIADPGSALTQTEHRPKSASTESEINVVEPAASQTAGRAVWNNDARRPDKADSVVIDVGSHATGAEASRARPEAPDNDSLWALQRDRSPTPDVRSLAPASPDPHEGIIEISVGAIHVHVEAAPKMVAQAAQTQRPQQPRQPRAARSGLARRYLRSL